MPRRRGALLAATKVMPAEAICSNVTPSQTLEQALQRRASVSPVCQLQLIVRRRFAHVVQLIIEMSFSGGV